MEVVDGKGFLFIVSGPAGTGKTTLCDRMLDETSSVQRVVTSTTRPPRAGEKDRVDYYFFKREVFEAKIAAGEFFEYARVHTNLYGTLRSEVLDKLKVGTDLLLNIDVQGAETYQKLASNDPLLKGRVVSIFIVPPSLDELRDRLSHRGTDDSDEIERRLEVAKRELKHQAMYDYRIESTSKDADFAALKRIYFEAKAGARD